MKYTGVVNLNDLIDALDLQSEFLSFFVDLSTGEVITLVEDEKETIKQDLYKEISLGLRKGEIMKDFCLTVEDLDLRAWLSACLQKEGEEPFLVAVEINQLEDLWLQYMDSRLKQLAIAWCEANGLGYVDHPREEDFFEEEF